MQPTMPSAARRARRLPLLAAPLLAALLPAQDLLVRGHTVVVAPDVVLTDGELLVRAGKIAFVGREIPQEARAKARVLDYGDATIVPGFVLAHTSLGQDNDLLERATALTPELHAAEAFDPFGDDLAALPKWAVTSAVLAPSSRNTAGGIAALVKPGKDQGTLADGELYLKLSLAAPARDPERPPTSLMGAVELLRTALQTAKNPAAKGADLQPLRAVLQQGRRAAIHAETAVELQAALDLGKEFGFTPVLLGAGEAYKCLDAIRAAGAGVVLGPLQPGLRLQQLQLPAQLERAGIRFAFAGNQPQWLRTSAALAVANGLSRAAALQALTRNPAELLGLQARLGSLRAGCDADFAVFGGDPIDLTSPLLAVHVGGERLAGKAPAAAKESR